MSHPELVVAAFGVALLCAALLSALAARSVLSTAPLFLLVGALAGPAGFGLLGIHPRTGSGGLLAVLADVALFVVLFTDGQQLRLANLRSAWRLPGHALLFGMPLTAALIGLLTWALTDFDWATALLVGAVLSPTDPVFASAIVKNEGMPRRLRHLLNVESGLNDGLALPVVVVLIAVAGGRDVHPLVLLGELAGGLLLGIGLPLVVQQLARLRTFTAEERLRPLVPLALGLMLYGIAHVAHVNPYLAAFAAGSTLATLNPAATESFEHFGDLLGEVGKFAALLAFGTLLTPALFGTPGIAGYALAVLVVIAARPLAFTIAGLWRRLPRWEFAAAAWFGPKGFASVVYGLYVLQSGLPERETAFAVIAITIALSIAAHSTTDVPIARFLDRHGGTAPDRDAYAEA